METLGQEKLCVLIIEDNPDHLRLVQHSVARLDQSWDMVAAGSIEDSLELLNSRPRFAVILLDLNLPDGRGLDCLRRVRERCGEAPIIVLTADDDSALAVEAVRQGAEDYILKQDMSGRLLIRAMRYAIERERLRGELVRVSLTDELTSLYNRRAFLALSRQQLAAARRSGQTMLLMFADLDGLKFINDTRGHDAGDRAISGVPAALRACFRDSDVISRLGGDEFAVLMTENTPDAEQVVRNRLHANLEARGLSLSAGVSRAAPEDDVSLEELMISADAALYAAKRAKQNTRVAA